VTPSKYLALLLAVLATVASIMPPPGYMPSDLIPLWGPFEYIRSNNRWICCGFSGLLVILSMLSQRRLGMASIPIGAWLLVGLHLLIFLKNLSGDPTQVGLLLLAFVVMLGATTLIASGWASEAKPISRVWMPLSAASLGFLAVNAIQYRINPEATMLIGDRFSGTTSNPQMFSLAIAIIAPILLYQFTKTGNASRKVAILAACLMLGFFIILTGSRLALLLTLFSSLVFFRQKILGLTAFLIPLIAATTLWTSWVQEIHLDSTERIFSTDNTRGMVWQSQLESLIANPLWGVPLGASGRVGFGENSYLAAGVGLGIAGLLLVLAFTAWVVQRIWTLVQIESKTGWNPELALPIAILSSCLVAAFFEAVLLGVFTFPLITMLYTATASEVVVKRFEKAASKQARRRQRLRRRRTIQVGADEPDPSTGGPHMDTAAPALES